MEIVQIFQDKKVRTYLDAENEDRFFSEVDEVALLTDSINLISYMETNNYFCPAMFHSERWCK